MLEDLRRSAVENTEDDNGEERTMLENKRSIDKNGQDLPEPHKWQWPLNHA